MPNYMGKKYSYTAKGMSKLKADKKKIQKVKRRKSEHI